MKRGEIIYNHILKQIAIPLLGNGGTYTDELTEVCKLFMPSSYVGTFSADTIPEMDSKECCIVNLDTLSEPGSHWISLVKTNDGYIFYDSFGRKQTTILPNLEGVVHDTEDDAEQDEIEQNCGARCLAWLLVAKFWGKNLAMHV